ncbi:MAG: hypothetical protein R2712_21560 [Vicinamibacterales bacterium]
MPAVQADTENCVAHNGSLIPIPGRDIMVQSWYQGGMSVFDFTDSTHPVEIAFFDRGPIDAEKLITGGYWSSYWFNGNIYGAEIARGIDIFRLLPSDYLTQNELDAAQLVRWDEFNSLEPAEGLVAVRHRCRAGYLDQLVRSKTVDAARAQAMTATLDPRRPRRRRASARPRAPPTR